jgi:hypothetical protein
MPELTWNDLTFEGDILHEEMLRRIHHLARRQLHDHETIRDLRAALASVTAERDALREALQAIVGEEMICNCGPLFRDGERLLAQSRAALERSAPE